MNRILDCMTETARRLVLHEGGNTAVEFGMVAPILFMAIIGGMQMSTALWKQNALNYAVEQAARCASIDANNCGSPTKVQSYAATLSGAGFASSVFTVAAPACGNQVTATYPYVLNIPLVGQYSFNLSATSCYPK